MWTSAICFSVQSVVTENEDGGQELWESWGRQIPASFKDSTRDDEVLAHQFGFTADVNIEIMACNYDRQAYLMDAATGDIYDVKRTFKPERSGTIVLTCQRRERGKAVNYDG